MSELALYVVATVVVLAGVAYFFVKQREQEALSQRKPTRGAKKTVKKETKEFKEPRENKPRKPRPAKEQEAPVLTKKQRANRDKEEDETKGVLDFLKGKKFSTEKSQDTAQAKIRSAPPAEVKKVIPKVAQVDSESDSGSDAEDYEKVTRKIKNSNNTKEKVEEEPQIEEKKGKKKPKFFTKQEAEEHENKIKAAKAEREARIAEREARKNRPPGEKRERRPRVEGDDEEFKAQRERRQQRRERTDGENGGEDNVDGDERRKSRYPPREPDQAPVFATDYEPADMDNILNSLTSYYNANPEANRAKPKPKRQPAAASAESTEESKAEADE